MQSLTLNQILYLHNRIIEATGGAPGIRDLKMLESSLAQPFMTFDGKDLYSSIIEKAGALGYSLIMNHAFIDGNKRIGHAAMELFLYLNGFEIKSDSIEHEKIILEVASGNKSRKEFINWLKKVVIKKRDET